MKKQFFTFLIAFFVAFTVNAQKVEHNETIYYGEYLPQEISNIGFGLNAKTFNDFMISNNITHRSNKSKTAFAITVENKPYKSIIYKFDSNLKVLIEIELRFLTDESAKKYMKDTFNKKKELNLHKDGAPYPMNAWLFNQKIFIVGKIPNSRWGN